MPNWTEEQKQAIYEKGDNILVAAAAGSGKTAVLVERMINKIINDKIDIDKILVVTFTNAAASEMRERILEAIYKKLDINPEDENLQRQINLLNLASICTIDSFCLQVIKNNFYELENISPNFRIGDKTEVELLREEVLEDLFEEKYEKDDEDFAKLLNTYTEYKDDEPLKELIKKIYLYIGSCPFPYKWLREKVEMFNIKEEDFSKTIWGKYLLSDVKENLENMKEELFRVLKELEYDLDLRPYYDLIENTLNNIKELYSNIDNWDKAYEIANKIEFERWSGPRKKSEIKDEAKNVRTKVKDYIDYIKNDILADKSENMLEGMKEIYVIFKKLENLILEFDERFTNKKREKNILDFTDVEHLALNILVKEDEKGNIIKTDVAKKYAEKFEEIAIDEYQDSNEVQEYILTSVSKGNNIFMVGDVKQSIYKFRQAMPELFLDKYKKYRKVNEIENEKNKENKEENEEESKEKKGIKIQLYKNFRSRKNVLDFTNMIFSNIMTEELGDVDYTEEEYLNLGASYSENGQNLKTEILVIDTGDNEEENKEEKEKEVNKKYIEEETEETEEVEHLEDIEIEAKYIAYKIKEMIDEKEQVYDNKKELFRDIKAKDIVILLRSTKEKAPIYEQELIKQGIPVYSDSNQEYLDTIEIETIMNLLRIIDNPIQDIPLVTVMRSPIGKFTDDELIQIRLCDKYDNFYECIEKSKINVEEKLRNKIEKFLEQIKKWREEEKYLSLDELIWKIYMDTGYYNYVGLMQNGIQRQANLKVLFERAREYEKASFKGLYNFIGFIEKLRYSSGDMDSAKTIGENDDVVRIMSIHKSKGLEFPVIFIANASKQFNKQDIQKGLVLLHQKYGIGPKYIDYDLKIKYDTVAREMIKRKIEIENLSEEMRILYVALTRAKEKIYITAAKKDYTEKFEKKEEEIRGFESNKKIKEKIKKANSYLEWIELVYLANMEKMKEISEFKIIKKEEIREKLRKNEEEEKNKKEEKSFFEIEVEKENEKEKNEKNEENEENEEIYNEIKEKLEYKYPYEEETKLKTKVSVSEIKKMKMENKNINDNKKEKEIPEITFKKPRFLEEKVKLTGAEKGTIMHLCLQELDFSKEYNYAKIIEFINELEEKGIITKKEKESIDVGKILKFTESEIYKEIKEAKLVEKEKPFYITIPAKDIYEKEIEGEILAQGVIDLYYITKDDKLILLDYKTDYVKEEKELVDKYKVQLEIYKKALEKSLDKKVDKTYIYSLYLGKKCDIM